MSATFATETESQSTSIITVESGEEAKMEPTSEQPMTQQPGPMMATSSQVPVNVEQDTVDQSTQQVPVPDRSTTSQPEASPLLAVAPLEGSSVDTPLVDLSDTSEANAKIETEDLGKAEGNTDVLVQDSVAGNAEVGEKFQEVDKLSNLAHQIDDFDPVSLLNSSDSVQTQDDETPETGESSLFSKDINDETLIDDLINDITSQGSEGKTQESIDVGSVLSEEKENAHNATDGNESNKDRAKASDDENAVASEHVKSVANESGVSLGDTVGDQVGNDNNYLPVSENGDSLLTAEDVDIGLEETTNGTMTISTESDGFNEDQNLENSAENGVTKTVTDQTSENKEASSTGDKKIGTVKSEATSPIKTGKTKRKEDKSIEHILKALSSLQTTEEKLAALCKKYADLHEEHRVLQSSFKLSQRKLAVVSREKDQLQAEHTKAVMAKSKLESLCRELQKHNQTIRQESIQRAKEEDEKRKEISQKFQMTISEIQQQMQENHDRNKQLREENFELANKLKKFIEQYEAREKQVEKVIQHRELEQKLADAKLEQASAILMEEKGKNQKEKELLLLQSTEFMKKLQIKDAELQMYKERYEEFQSTISKSEEMFQKFKTEMEKMTKRTKKLEKDGAQWKVKWENANRALLEMADEKTKYDKEKGVLLNKISKLESLCRAMQAERQARKMLDTETMDASSLEKVSNLIPPEVRQAPAGGESHSGVGGVMDKLSTKPPLPSGDMPDVEPGPSEPSPTCTELENINPDDSLDSGDTELTDTTVIPKEPTKDIIQPDIQPNNTSDGQSENPLPPEPCVNQSDQNQQLEQNQSTNQDGFQATEGAAPDNQSAS